MSEGSDDSPKLVNKFLNRIGLSKDRKAAPEPDAIPLWYRRATQDMSPADQQAIAQLRQSFASTGPSQLWYYAGSGGDVSPVFIAPPSTRHWRVDVGYDRTHNFFRPVASRELTEPFEKLGSRVETARSWDQGWQDKRQTVTIGGQTRLELIGGGTQVKSNTPESIDVIYTNPYSTSPGPDAWIALKTGGLYVVANDREGGTKTRLHMVDKDLEDFGLRRTKTVKVDSLHFPLAGKTAGTTDGKTIWYQIYEKSRPFTPEEEDLLQLNSSQWEADFMLDQFIFRFNPKTLPVEIVRDLEKQFTDTFVRHFDRLNHLKGENKSPAYEIQSHFDSLFPEDGTLPEVFKKSSLYEHRDKDDVYRFHQQAVKMYRSLKARAGW